MRYNDCCGELFNSTELNLGSLREGSVFDSLVSDDHAILRRVRKKSLFSISVGLQVRNQQDVSEQVCDKSLFSSSQSQRTDSGPVEAGIIQNCAQHSQGSDLSWGVKVSCPTPSNFLNLSSNTSRHIWDIPSATKDPPALLLVLHSLRRSINSSPPVAQPAPIQTRLL